MFWKKKKPIRNRREHPVVRFLRSNMGCAFTVEVITYVTDMNGNTVRSMLRKLVDDKKVGHVKPFFYWK